MSKSSLWNSEHRNTEHGMLLKRSTWTQRSHTEFLTLSLMTHVDLTATYRYTVEVQLLIIYLSVDRWSIVHIYILHELTSYFMKPLFYCSIIYSNCLRDTWTEETSSKQIKSQHELGIKCIHLLLKGNFVILTMMPFIYFTSFKLTCEYHVYVSLPSMKKN